MVQLLKLNLEGFGKFSAARIIDFDNGVTFITGLNEAGKSTVLEAIMASIFKYSKSQIEPYICWENKGACKIALTYKTAQDETYRIHTDYTTMKRKLERINNDEVEVVGTVDRNIDPKLKEHFGFNDKKVFENTAFIRQSQMAISSEKLVRNKIKDMIEEVFVGRAEASATKAIAKITKVAKDSRKEVTELNELQDELEQKIQEAEAKQKKVKEDSSQYRQVTQELEEKSPRLDQLQIRYKKHEQKETLTKKGADLNEKIDKIDQVIITVKDNLEKKAKNEEKQVLYKGYEQIPDADEIKKLISEINTSKTSLSTLENSNRTIKTTEEKLNKGYVALFAIGIILCIIVIGIPIAYYAYKRMKIKIEKTLVDHEKENQISALKEKISTTTQQLTAQCQSIKNFNPASFVEDYSNYQQLLHENRSLSNTLADLLRTELSKTEIDPDDKQNLRKLETKKMGYLNEHMKIETNLEEFKLVNFTQDDLDELNRLEQRVTELTRMKNKLEGGLERAADYVEDPEGLKENLTEIKEKKLALNQRAEEHEIAAKFLQLAESQVQQKFTPAITTNSTSLLKAITAEKYSELKIDENTMEIFIKAPEIDEYVEITCLSQGTQDQLYFTLRSVMSDLLGGNANIPLILDDPFHNFDQVRLNKTMNAIKQVSKSKQVILISHRPYHEEYKDLCGNIIKL